MTVAYPKPLPDVHDPATERYWTAASEGRLVCQRCVRCGELRWTPRWVCPECLSFEYTWDDLRPSGRLYSWTTYHRAFDRRFNDDIPYSVAQVELDDGPRMIGRILGDPTSFVAGDEVEAVFDAVTDSVTLVHWRPITLPSAE